MQDFLSFVSFLFEALTNFLLSEPIIWFVGVFLLLFIAGAVKRIIS